MNDEIRYKAAAAIVALAHRAESAGRKEAKSASGKSWVEMPYDSQRRMNPGKLREAIEYYQIAESIDRDAAGWGHPRALLLEAMGDWDEAVAAFSSLSGTVYQQAGELGVRRCAEKRAGNYDEFAAFDASPELQRLIDIDPDADDPELDAAIDAKLARLAEAQSGKAKSRKKAAGVAGSDESPEQLAAQTALTFVNHLLERNYAAAQSMLHSWESATTADELREEFEALFDGEAFPQSANVFDVQTDMPQLDVDDLAWVYVSIDSENQEAVSLHVARDRKRLAVYNIEFGRP